MKKALYISLFLLTLPYIIVAQTATVFGAIKNQKKELLQFVSVSLKDTNIGTTSDVNGNYQLLVPANKNLKLVYSFIGYKTDTVSVMLKENVNKKVNIQLKKISNLMTTHLIKDETNRESTAIDIKGDSKKLPTVGGGIEDLIKSQPGVSSNNELSSQYSVRGGNFDENLVYVNEIEIYRPSLIRSGQQEGLSFVNPDLIKKIVFSAGGFDAKYGDKMSSVLDITYKTPTKFKGSVSTSLLGAAVHFEGIDSSKKISYIIGSRYKTNKYLLNSLPTKGEYNPEFFDVQSLVNYKISPKSELEFLTNYSINKFQIIPKNSQSTFGTTSETLQLRVFFEGEESDKFETAFGALKYTYKVDSSLYLKLIASSFKSIENEAFDILSEYNLSELDPTSGSEVFNKGFGAFRRHARNDLDVTVLNIAHRGKKVRTKNKTEWEIKFQKEIIIDAIEQWQLTDSAGFTIPQGTNNEIIVQNTANSTNSLKSTRISSFVQHNWKLNIKYSLIAGIRANYWSFTKQLLIAPRATVAYKPNWQKDFLFRFSSGIYQQPPFYKELKNLDGTVNQNIKSQESIHFVLGSDYNFKAWGNRPFKFITELYYKQLNNLIPYQIDNVQVRYLPNQIAKGYTTGIDMKIHGEFVKGVDSWASLSLLTSEEDIVNDGYFDANGLFINPGYIARPTDQRFNFSIFFQDYLPEKPTVKVHLNLMYASGLPFGPASSKRHEDTFRMPSYKRVDIGFSKQLKAKGNEKSKLLKHFTSSWLSFEVFNLLQTNNTISYLWIKDFENSSYAVPNFLTSRRLNLKLIMEF